MNSSLDKIRSFDEFVAQKEFVARLDEFVAR